MPSSDKLVGIYLITKSGWPTTQAVVVFYKMEVGKQEEGL